LDKKISIILPVFNEENNIEEIYNQITCILLKIPCYKYEIIFIDDGSTDNSWNIITTLYVKDDNIKAIKLSRNFGHDIAIKAGLDHSNGDLIIVMDTDLQHPPELINTILDTFKNEHPDIILMKRKLNKDEILIRRISNKIYYKTFGFLTNIEIEEGISDFFAINNKVLQIMKQYNQKNIFIRGILLTIGFKKKIIEYVANERYSGNSKYNLKKLIILSKNSCIGFTSFPLRIIEGIGLILSLLSFFYGMYSIIKTLLLGSISGWASTVTTIAFLNGFILLLLTVYIEYFIVAFDELKEKPIYIIDKKN